MHDACSRLRYAEGLRRKWAQARAEASVREAVNLAWIEGARTDVAEIRQAVMAVEQPSLGPATSAVISAMTPAQLLALGIWRAMWGQVSELPELNTGRQSRAPLGRVQPPPALIAGINRDVCSFLVSEGVAPSTGVAVPNNPSAIREAVALIQGGGVSGSATVRAAQVLRALIQGQPFSQGNVAGAFVVTKVMLARQGVEPTGVAVLSRVAAAKPAEFSLLRESGSQKDWIGFMEESVLEGCGEGESIARMVQAGRIV